MAGKKINDLTPLGRNLIATDELELSLTGATGSRKITGAELTAGLQPSLTLTTTGTSGAATLVGSTLNIPQYSGGGGSVTTIEIGTTGTTVTGTTANTITQSILIPANTLSANNSLELIARFSKTGTAGSGTYRLYFNTSNSLTGATLIASFYTIGTGATIVTHQNTRSFFYDGTNLSNNIAASTSSISDMIQQTISGLSVAYTSSSAYYLIFAIQLSQTADSSVISGYRVLKYA